MDIKVPPLCCGAACDLQLKRLLRSDLIMDLLFCIDLALNFITSVSTPNGLITDFSAISIMYLRSW